MIKITPTTSSLCVSQSHAPNTCTLTCVKALRLGWHYIELKARNQTARDLIASSIPLFVQQNDNLQGVEVRPVAPNRCALVFFRHSDLTKVSIQWPEQASEFNGALFTIKVRNVKSHRAWLHMMHQVSRYHKQQGQNWQHIYRITRARIKRAGHEEALRKLVREYQPLLQHQLISCEPYSFWQNHFESAAIESPLNTLADHDHAPRFRIIVRSGGEKRLTRTLESIARQHYANWQAFVDVDNLPSAFRDHQRIACIDPSDRFTSSEHWYLLIESGDELADNALAEFAEAINARPNAKMHYSDHDCTNAEGVRSAPQFKPDWSPDYYYSMDYIGFATTIHGSILASVLTDNDTPWWRQHPVDSKDAAISLLPAARRDSLIHHVAKVLYHQWADNPVLNHNTDSLRALLSSDQQRVHRIEQLGPVFKIDHQLPVQPPMVSLLVPTRDALDITRTCIESVLQKTSYPNYEIIILNNQSSDPQTLAWFTAISEHPQVRVLDYDHPFNYSAINNYGARHANGEIIGLLNNDTEVINPEWLTELVMHAARPDIGCVGAKLYYFDDTVQHGGVIVGLYGIAGHAHKNVRRLDTGYMHRLVSVQNFTAVTAACLLIKRTIYDEVGGLNETDLTVAFNDVDFCLKVHAAGYRNLWTPYAELYHYESKSRGADNTPVKIARAQKEGQYMRDHWADIIAHDPAYNPNLTRMREDFGLRLEKQLPNEQPLP